MRTKAPFSMATTGHAPFTVSLGGEVLGETAFVSTRDVKGGGAQDSLLAHELTHVLQNRAPGKTGARKLTLGRITPARGAFSGSLAGLHTARGKRVRIASGRNGAVEFTVLNVDANAAQQEWTITYENIQRIP